MVWRWRSVCWRGKPFKLSGPGSSVTGTATYPLWRLWLECALSLRAPTSSGSELNLENGSGARSVNLVPQAVRVPCRLTLEDVAHLHSGPLATASCPYTAGV